MDNLNQVEAAAELELNKPAISAWEFNIPTAKSLLELNQACHTQPSPLASPSNKLKVTLLSSVANPLPLVVQHTITDKRASLGAHLVFSRKSYRSYSQPYGCN